MCAVVRCRQFRIGNLMFSPTRLRNALGFSLQGLRSAWQTEAAFRDNFAMVLLAQLLCVYVQPALWLWLLFGLSNTALLCMELLNTGLEYLVDFVSLEHHDLLGRTKDVGSAAVFVMMMFNGIMLLIIVYGAL